MDFLYALIFSYFFFFFETPCLVVTVQPRMEWNSIKKKTKNLVKQNERFQNPKADG